MDLSIVSLFYPWRYVDFVCHSQLTGLSSQAITYSLSKDINTCSGQFISGGELHCRYGYRWSFVYLEFQTLCLSVILFYPSSWITLRREWRYGSRHSSLTPEDATMCLSLETHNFRLQINFEGFLNLCIYSTEGKSRRGSRG